MVIIFFIILIGFYIRRKKIIELKNNQNRLKEYLKAAEKPIHEKEDFWELAIFFSNYEYKELTPYAIEDSILERKFSIKESLNNCFDEGFEHHSEKIIPTLQLEIYGNISY